VNSNGVGSNGKSSPDAGRRRRTHQAGITECSGAVDDLASMHSPLA
jgi:hypothetical protein